MNYFLAKTEPSTYSIEDLEEKEIDVWNGVRNPMALKFIKTMMPGDRVLIYHSGGHPEIVGLAEVIGEPEPDPNIKKSWTVEMKFLQKFAQPIGLKEIKDTNMFGDFRLVYQSRLSTMSVPENFIEWLKTAKKLKI